MKGIKVIHESILCSCCRLPGGKPHCGVEARERESYRIAVRSRRLTNHGRVSGLCPFSVNTFNTHQGRTCRNSSQISDVESGSLTCEVVQTKRKTEMNCVETRAKSPLVSSSAWSTSGVVVSWRPSQWFPVFVVVETSACEPVWYWSKIGAVLLTSSNYQESGNVQPMYGERRSLVGLSSDSEAPARAIAGAWG